MDKMKIEKSDCTCNSDCCQPTKGKLWKKILFVAILFLAVAIVSFKLIEKNNAEFQIKANTTDAQQPACCDTTVNKGFSKITDSNKSCCPKPKE